MVVINIFLLGAHQWGPFLQHIISGHEDPAATVLPQHAEDNLSPSTSDLHFLRGDMESITTWDGNSSASPTCPERSLMAPFSTLSPGHLPHFTCKEASSVDETAPV